MDNTIFTAFGKEATLNKVLTFMKITGEYEAAKSAVVTNEVIADHAKHENIKINNDALQTLSDLKRIQLGLHNSEEMNKYLNNIGIDIEIWEEAIELELYRHHIKNTNGNNLFVIDLWKFVKGLPAVRNHIADAVVNYAKEKGLKFTDEELQKTSDSLRRIMDLHDSDEFTNLLNSLSMNDDDWEKYVHSHITLHKIDADTAFEIFNREVKNAVLQYPVIHNLASDIILSQIIHAKAKSNKIKIETSEIQDYIDTLRRALNLHSLKTFNLWLEATGFHIDEFEYLVETELLKKKFAEKGIELFDHNKIKKLILAGNHFAKALNSVKVYMGIVDHAEKNGIKVSDEDLNLESEYLRRAYNLHNSEEFKAYLESKCVSLEDWEWFCEYAAIIRKVYKNHTDTKDVLNYLESNEQVYNNVKDLTFNNFINKNINIEEVKF